MGYEGAVLTTDDGGQTRLQQAKEPNLFEAVDLLLLSENDRLLAGRNDLFWTDDGGQTWHEGLSGASIVFRRLVQRADTFYAVNMNDGLYRSTDSGRSWTLLPGQNDGRLHDLLIVDDSLALLADHNGLLWRSTDGLQSWDSVQIDERTDLGRLSQSSAQDFWLLNRHRSDTILHSQDRGQTWTKEQLPRSTSWRAIEWIDSLRGYVVGGSSDGGTILETTDGGQSWQEVLRSMAIFTDLTLGRGDSTAIWATGQGGQIYRLTLPIDTMGTPTDTSHTDTSTTALVPGRSAIWRVFPNPSSDYLYVQGESSPGVPWLIELYDLQGRQLRTQRVLAGEGMLDLRSLPADHYWLRLRQGPREEWHPIRRP